MTTQTPAAPVSADSKNNDNMGYVSLHNHTTFSILDSLIKPIQLFKKAKELGQTAVAVTDHGTMAGMWDALKASKETGVKLIAGCEFYFVDNVKHEDSRLRHVILLAKNEQGYKNLLQASAEGYDNYIVAFRKAIPRIDWKILEKYSDGLICLTACSNGIIGQLINEKNYDEAEGQAQRLQSIFGNNLGLEVQPHYLKRTGTDYSVQIDQALTNRKIREIAERHGIRCVATTDAHYVTPEQHDSHDLLLAVAAGTPVNAGSRLKYNVPDFYIKSGQEVYEKLKRQFILDDDEGDAFARKCIENSAYFAGLCEEADWVDPKYSNPSGKELPQFPVQDQKDYDAFKQWSLEHPELANKDEDERYLRYRCYLGLVSKIPEEKHAEYQARLEEEYEVMEYHKFSSYMLIVMDYIEWAKNNDIPVGPGRGSVGGSLIGYLSDIHMVDPIKYGLIFARFHNKQKTSFPDIDTDFAPSGRSKVQDYIRQKYGEDHVAHVSNVNTMTPKVYARAIARSFTYGGDRKTAVGVGTAIADAIPNDIKSVSQALEKAALFGEYAKAYPELKKYAEDLGGKAVAWSTHAGGVVIGKRSLREIVPIRRDKDGNVAIEYEKERAESNGLVKMDTLGLETLDIIDETYKLIAATGKKLPPRYPNFDEYDKKTYDLISRGDTFCVFQLGTSGGTIDLCRKVKPHCIEDIAVINSLARPSARDIRTGYVEVRDGKKPVEILHPTLDRAFKPTLGFGLYEECLLYLAQDVAGWSLHSADRLRKLTKEKGKNPEKAAKWKQEFIEDSVKNGVPEDTAVKIWDDVVDKFQGYGFNKSHAIFYSLIGYHTAWLKAHYPLEFLVANLRSEVNSNAKVSKDNIAKIKEEIRRLGVKILPPDINKSEMTYKIIDENTLMTGLDSLKYMGKDAIPEILEKRPFTSFEDFLLKVDGRKVRAPAIQALAASGCLGGFEMSRKLMFLYAADYKAKLTAFNKRKKADGYEEFNYPWPEEDDWTISEKCALERFYLGESLSGDKVQEYNGFFTYGAIDYKNLPKLHPPPPSDMPEKAQRKYTRRVTSLQGEVKNLFEFKVKKEGSKIQGEVMAKITLEDPHGNQMMMTCFPDGWVKLQDRCMQLSGNKQKIDVGVGLYINGSLNWYEGDISLIFEDLAKFSPPPQLPDDLKAKKVSMKIPRARTKKSKEEESDRNILLEEIEEELSQQGNADLDEWNDMDPEEREAMSGLL